MHRRPPERSFLFGIHPVLEALSEGKSLHRVLFLKGKQTDEMSDILRRCRELSVPAQAVPKERLDRVTQKNHQGVIAFVSPIEYQPLDEVVMSAFERGEYPRLLALDGVTDVRNLGAIARTAECFGITALVVPSTGSAPVNEDAIKSSAGALLRLPMCRVTNMETAVKNLSSQGLKVVGVTEKATEPIASLTSEGPLCLVMGDEHAGISSEVLAQCDSMAMIPMTGQTGSLNVGVAAGIALYALRTPSSPKTHN